MLNRLLFLILFLPITTAVFAKLNLFNDESVKSLHMIKEMYSIMTKDGEVFTFKSPSYGVMRGGEKTKWISIYIDFENERLSARWIERETKPRNYIKPDQIRVFNENTYYDISHPSKRIYIDTINIRQLTSYFALSGWYYDGINLSDTILSFPKEGFTTQEDGTISFWLKPPQTQHPAEIFLHPETKRVSKVKMVNSDPRFDDETIEMVETIEWTNIKDTDFWYPSYLESNLDGTQGIKTVSKTWVREITINPVIPQTVFDTKYPKEIHKNRSPEIDQTTTILINLK